MVTNNRYDLIVIGTGAAGSAGWEVARRLGRSVAVFERDVLGGECPTFACVPTKALLHCAEVYRTILGAGEFGIDVSDVTFGYKRIKARKDEVVSHTGAAQGERPFVEAGAHLVRGEAKFVGPKEIEAGGERYTAGRFLIATGAGTRVPEIDGLSESGYITFREAIDLTELPSSILILGGGAVGCEFTELFASFGVEVTIVDHNLHLLSKEDPEVGLLLGELFRRRGVRVLTQATAQNVRREDGRKLVTITHSDGSEPIAVDEILVATGKAPHLNLGLDAAGVCYDEKGIEVDETLRTSNPNVYAGGDVVGPYRFTHAGSYQGWLAVNNAFLPRADRVKADYSAMPRCVFTSPEVATIGLTEREAREQGVAASIGFVEIAEASRADTASELDGFVKVIANSDGKIVGASIVAARAGEMLHELAVAMTVGATTYQIASTVHAFPTFSEAVQMACAQATE